MIKEDNTVNKYEQRHPGTRLNKSRETEKNLESHIISNYKRFCSWNLYILKVTRKHLSHKASC